jgi:hypothetical protein
MSVVLLTDLGHRELALRALQEANAKALLQLKNAAAQLRFRYAERPAGCCIAVVVDDCSK